MYYQTKAVSKDEAWTTCTIVDTTEDNYIVEYTEDGKFVTKEINTRRTSKTRLFRT